MHRFTSVVRALNSLPSLSDLPELVIEASTLYMMAAPTVPEEHVARQRRPLPLAATTEARTKAMAAGGTDIEMWFKDLFEWLRHGELSWESLPDERRQRFREQYRVGNPHAMNRPGG
jgi:hypothetical protein